MTTPCPLSGLQIIIDLSLDKFLNVSISDLENIGEKTLYGLKL